MTNYQTNTRNYWSRPIFFIYLLNSKSIKMWCPSAIILRIKLLHFIDKFIGKCIIVKGPYKLLNNLDIQLEINLILQAKKKLNTTIAIFFTYVLELPTVKIRQALLLSIFTWMDGFLRMWPKQDITYITASSLLYVELVCFSFWLNFAQQIMSFKLLAMKSSSLLH